MSKNIRKNISAASAVADELADRRADQARAKLELRDHEFTTTESNEANAPCGNAPSTAEQVSGTTVFDIIPRLSSVGQITALRSIANGAIISAVYAAHDAVTVTDEDRELAARVRMAQQAELYSYAAAELQTLASTPYDLPMSIDQAVEFAESSAAAQKPDKLPQEVLDALGIDEAQLAVIDALEQQRAVQRAADLRQSIRDNREAILAEVNSFVDVSGAPNEVVSRLVADQHRALYEKVAAKLQARMAQLIGMRSRYSGALGEALLLTSDIKDVDKAYVTFVKKNQGEFRAAA